MASLTLYGSNVADATLSTACDLTINTGGSETHTDITGSGTNPYAEVTPKGNGSTTGFTSIPAPTGKGWVYQPGAGTFATGNWSASVKMDTPSATNATLRFSRYSGGSYSTIGTIVASLASGTNGTVISFAATSMSTITFGSSDLLYVDLWFQDATGIAGDVIGAYVSTSATAGVANDMQVTTSSWTAGGVTTTTYSFTDALVVSDIGGIYRWPVDSLSASDSPLATDTALSVDSLSASDLGGIYRWPVDALSVADSLSAAATALPTDTLTGADSLLAGAGSAFVEANAASDALGGGSIGMLTDSLATSDALSSAGMALPVDALAAGDTALAADTYQPADDALAVSDSFSYTDVPAGTVTTTYSFTDTLTVSDIGGIYRWPVESLTASDSMVTAESYVPAEVANVAESLLAGESATWVELLPASDSGVWSEASPQPPQYLMVTWVTRDGKVTWKTRDDYAQWRARDEQAAWVARDEKDTWTTRDEQATWKTRG